MSKLKKILLAPLKANSPKGLLNLVKNPKEELQKFASIATDPDPTGKMPKSYTQIADAVIPTVLSMTALGAPAAAAYVAGRNFGQTGNLGSALLKGGINYATNVGGSYLGSALSGAASKTSAGLFGGGTGGATSAYAPSNIGSYANITDDAISNIGSNIGSNSASLGSGVGSTVASGAGNVGTGLSNLGSTLSNVGSNVASNSGSLLGNLTKYAPLLSAGMGAVSNLRAEDQLLEQQKKNAKLYAPYLNPSFNPGDLTQDPGYQFQLAQGNQALNRKQSATGNYFSGQALKEAQDYGQGLAGTTYQDAFNRYLAQQQQGLTAAQQAAGVNTNIGNIKGNTTTNMGNLFSSSLGSLLGRNGLSNTGASLGNEEDPYLAFMRQNALKQSLYGY